MYIEWHWLKVNLNQKKISKIDLGLLQIDFDNKVFLPPFILSPIYKDSTLHTSSHISHIQYLLANTKHAVKLGKFYGDIETSLDV